MHVPGRQMAAVRLPRIAGPALGAVFGAVAAVRRDRPLHPKGVVLHAVVNRTGSIEPWGSAWLDQPGEDHGLVRLSRAVGLPAKLPDILGLALTWAGDAGQRHDVLLATTGLSPLTRFLLVPRRDPVNSGYASLLPYSSPRGPVLLAAVPARRRPAVRLDGVASEAARQPLWFRLLVATPFGGWHQFGSLKLTAREHAAADPPLRFDPVRNPPQGLRWHRPLAEVREPAYAAARRFGPAREPGTPASGSRGAAGTGDLTPLTPAWGPCLSS
ncbi:MAG TPA: hypothetical protein VFB84_21880 [Micromonosporaceae bacterium]|nr:hypothetical protein [Micromonosporaceae bacterium]